MDTPHSLATAVGTLLQYVAPQKFGDRFVAETDVPPRYIWVPEQSVLGPPLTLGGNPRALAGMETTFNVHCWGKEHDDVTAMIAFLIKGVQKTVLGKRYTIGNVSWSADKHDALGWLAVVPVLIKVDVHDLVIPTVMLANPRDGIVKHLVSAEYETVTATPGTIANDGKLVTGE